MRSHLIIILCLLPFCLQAQTPAIVKEGRWVSEELNSLVFRNDYVLDAIFDGTPEHTNYVFKGDTLVLVKNYYSSVDEFAFRRTDSAKFFIKKATARQLVLVPANVYARNLARASECSFKNLPYIAAEKFLFQSLSINTTLLSWDPAFWNTTVDRQGNLAYTGTYAQKKAARSYTGKLNPAQLDTLQNLLQHSLLSRLKTFRQNVALTYEPDTKLVITTADGKAYTMQSQLIPANLEPVLSFIGSLVKRLQLAQQQ